ncbi:MAG: peptidoglycan-binding protein [Actinomycetota bacterium]
MRTRRWLPSILVAGALVAALIVTDPLSRFGDDTGGDAAVVRDRTELSIVNLSTTNEADGELMVTDRRMVSPGTAGTVTAVVEPGTPAVPGLRLFTIDDATTTVLTGAVPTWRTMTVDDVGADVAQLEAGLADLGYDPDGLMTVDATFTDATSAAVERWQADLGLPETGVVALGTIVFAPAGSIVSSVDVTAGDRVTGEDMVLTLATTDRVLRTAIGGDLLRSIEVGDALSARLPDRSTVDAAVTDIAAAGDGTWWVTADLADPTAALPEGEAVPVTVSWTEVVAAEVTAVRANALTRLDGGAYAVEVVDDDGSTRFVEVGIGQRSGSTVELVTDLPAGTVVIAP